jgi:tetratricopeptide (TPR) repeat protein
MFQTFFCGGMWVLCALTPLVANSDEIGWNQSQSGQSGLSSRSPSPSPSKPSQSPFQHRVKKDGAAKPVNSLDEWEASRIEALAAASKHNYPQAESTLQRLVQEAGESKSTGDRLVIALKDLASVYASDKKFGDARVAYQRVLKIDEQKYGRESPMLITPLNDVIKVTCVTGKCYDTIPELKRLLAIRRKAHGAHSRAVPVTLLLLGEAYEKHGDFSQAVIYFTEAVATEKKISGHQSAMAAALAKNTERAKQELAYKQREESKQKPAQQKRKQVSNQLAPAKRRAIKSQAVGVRPIIKNEIRYDPMIEY